MSAMSLVVEAGEATARMARDGVFVEIPLERDEAGQLTEATRLRIIAALRENSVSNGGLFPRRALCAVGARGLSLRRLTAPAVAREKLGSLLRLQVENEFPVPPEQLAWGWQILGTSQGPGGKQNDVLVAAVRRSALEEWTGLFAEAGTPVSFTPAALARWAVMAAPEAECGLLEVGAKNSELLVVAKNAPTSARALPWGAENLAEATLPAAPGRKLFLTGAAASRAEVAERMTALNGAAAQPLLPLAGTRSGTIAALQKLAAGESSRPALLLEGGEGPSVRKIELPQQWTALAAALAVCLLVFPYLEALLFNGHLTRRLNEVRAEESRFGVLDKELSFFQFLRKTQPPTLDLFNLIAQSAPPGTSLESYTLTRGGELSLRGKLGNGEQVTDFRNKLMESGWFSTVVVDEQTQQPDRRVSVRLTAQLKAADFRRPLPAAMVESKEGKPTKA